MIIYLKVNVSDTEVDDNGCKRQKDAVHLEKHLLLLNRLSSVGWIQQRGSWTRWAGKQNRSQGTTQCCVHRRCSKTKNRFSRLAPKQWWSQGPVLISHRWNLNQIYSDVAQNWANCINTSQRILPPYCALNLNSLPWIFPKHCNDKLECQKPFAVISLNCGVKQQKLLFKSDTDGAKMWLIYLCYFFPLWSKFLDKACKQEQDLWVLDCQLCTITEMQKVASVASALVLFFSPTVLIFGQYTRKTY